MNTNMTGFRCFSKIFVLVFCMRVDLALEGLTCAFTECSLRASNKAINSSILVALPHIFQRFSSLWLYYIGTPRLYVEPCVCYC